MKTLKTFENFNSSSSADEYIKSVLSKLGLKYNENFHDDDAGGDVHGAEIKLDDEYFIFYIFASHPDKESATYHITYYIDGELIDDFSTPDLEGSLTSLINPSEETSYIKNEKV